MAMVLVAAAVVSFRRLAHRPSPSRARTADPRRTVLATPFNRPSARYSRDADHRVVVIRRWTMMLAIDDDSFRVARSFASLSPHVGCHARISIALIPILSIDSPATSRPRAFTWCAPTASLFLSLSPASLVLDVASTSTNECVRADPVRRDRRSRISLRHAKINKMAASAAERLRSLPKCSNRTPIYVYVYIYIYIYMYVCMCVCDTHGMQSPRISWIHVDGLLDATERIVEKISPR